MLFAVENVALICLSFIFFKFEKKVDRPFRRFFHITLIVLFSLLMAMRPLETPDTQHYVDFFEQLYKIGPLSVNLLQKYQGYEYGFVYLLKAFRFFSTNYRILFFVISLFSSTAIIYGMKELVADYKPEYKKQISEGYYGFIIFVFMAYWGLAYCGIAIRAGLSLAFGLNAFNCFNKRKYILGILLFFLAFIMQRMSILLLVAWVFYKIGKKLPKKFYGIMAAVFCFFVCTGLANTVMEVMMKFVATFITQSGVTGYNGYLSQLDPDFGIIDIFWILVFIILIIYMTTSEKYCAYLNVVMIGIAIIVFLHGIRAINRAYDYFLVFTTPLLFDLYYGKTARNIDKNKGVALLITLACMVIMLRVQLKLGM